MPTKVVGGLSFSSIDVGFNHSCAITAAGVAYCWGGDDLGQLGDGAPAASRTSPSAVAGGHTYSVIRAGSKHTCALETSTGYAYCWGANGFGQSSPPPGSFSALSAGYYTCAIRSADGSIVCWGEGNIND